MTQKMDRIQLLLWNVMKKHKPTNRNRDAFDYMGVPDEPSHCGSNKPTFSQIKQAVPEI